VLTSVRHGPGDSGWGRAALALLLLGGLLMAFNQQHSGDPLKIRRELRKF
jgi:MYXO-CTERM domain-containing protein